MNKNYYRADIDGLRAIAIVSVLIFHAFPGILHSGFIGVDVFFVISGYLISGILYKSIGQGSFSFIDFYQRRINRIFPALLAVLIFSMCVGWFGLLQHEYAQLGKHVASGSAFLSNFILWSEINYFDNASETKPLLHLWSLAIEEQFYLLWPPLLLLIFKANKKYIFPVILIIAIVSFAYCISLAKVDLSAAFYNPAARAWELLCGALLAWHMYSRNQIPGAQRSNIFAFLGLCLLVVGFLVIEKNNFPGWKTIFPVFGTVMLIAAGPQSWINGKLLSSKPVVFIGLISYPLYLWHWPLLVFPKVVGGLQPSYLWQTVLLLISFVLAFLTYRCIEKPLRSIESKSKSIILLVAVILVGTAGYVIYRNDGVASRKYANLQNFRGDLGHTKFHEYVAKDYFPCTDPQIEKKADRWESFVRCAQSKPGPDIDVVLLGDSHAEHLFIGVASALDNKNVTFLTKGEMPFLSNPEAKYLIEYAAGLKSASTVIISARWRGRIDLLKPGVDFEKELDATVDFLIKNNKKVVIALDTPSFPFEPSVCKGDRWINWAQGDCSMPAAPYQAELNSYKGFIQSIAARHGATVVDLSGAFCDGKVCHMTGEGEIFYRDFHHLNINGSAKAGKFLVDKYKQF
ncbi:acyltransferase family protein [Sphingobacterium multivorum]|uniref:acyltransferase family protein n=1 Tax=Sphingobacterium multivorum TaxID=28454 RepID=UPI0028A8B0AA|nr:acyltransferase family protein [Sphingobacterium multivorum]